jgi:hypothetical protein
MDLLTLSSAVKVIVTEGVLAAAVIVDAIARRQRRAAGRVCRLPLIVVAITREAGLFVPACTLAQP